MWSCFTPLPGHPPQQDIGGMKPAVLLCTRAVAVQRALVCWVEVQLPTSHPHCGDAYHDDSNHDGSDTDQVQLPREELVNLFVAACVSLKQRTNTVSTCCPPTFPRYPKKHSEVPAFPLSHSCLWVLALGLPTGCELLKQEHHRKYQQEPGVPLHNLQINNSSTLYPDPK